jgi:serine/threonine protein kinase
MEAQMTHPRWEELAAFDVGRLSDQAWALVAEHVARCDRCSALLDTAPGDAFVALLRASAADPLAATHGVETPCGALPTSDATVASGAPAIPAVLAAHPRYRVLGPLGGGGMGAVFKAEHVLMGRVVAVKILRPDLRGRPDAAERFCQEVRTLARLCHPNVVTAFDAEQVEDVLFLVMEYVEGESLERILRRCGRLPVELARDWVRQAALGLQFAFEQGVIHRDLKPANILLTAQGQVKILDFGLARLLGDGGDPGRTPDGAVLGTPRYVAPEQARDSRAADVRSDLYSLGCTWYEMLTGRPPFPGPTVLEQLLAHQDQAPAPLAQARPDVPSAISDAIDRLLAKDPTERFQTPQELLQALEPDSPPAAPNSRRRMPRRHFWAAFAAAAVALVLLAAAGWWWWLQPRESGHPQTRPESGVNPKPEGEKNRPEGEKNRSARDQTVAWLKANSAPGLDFRVAEDTGRQLDANPVKGKAFLLRLGPKLVKSGRQTILAGRHQDFFAFELPDEVASIPGLTTTLTVTAEQSQEFLPDPPVRLSSLQIKQKLALDGDQEVTGSVSYDARAPVAGKLACRLTFMLGTSTRTYYWLLEEDRLAGQGVLPFAFNALYCDGNRRTGPVVLFFDVCSLNDPTSKAKALVLSSTCAELVMVRDVKAKK